MGSGGLQPMNVSPARKPWKWFKVFKNFQNVALSGSFDFRWLYRNGLVLILLFQSKPAATRVHCNVLSMMDGPIPFPQSCPVDCGHKLVYVTAALLRLTMNWREPYCSNGKRRREEIRDGGSRTTPLSSREAKHRNLFCQSRLKALQREYSVWGSFPLSPAHLSSSAWALWPKWDRQGTNTAKSCSGALLWITHSEISTTLKNTSLLVLFIFKIVYYLKYKANTKGSSVLDFHRTGTMMFDKWMLCQIECGLI